MSSEAAISINHLSKVYALGRSGRTNSFATIIRERARHPIRGGTRRERFRALDDVTFDVAPGEVVGVIGKNGAGKSTLLKILSRITRPTEGYVDLSGRVGSLLEVGTGFHNELTGVENVYLNGTILGMTKREIDSRLDAIVDFAEVDRFLDTPVKRYSSGMRVRLAFAVAAHLEPEILIIDEVLSVGDAGFQSKCLDKMKQVSSEDGRTVMYVSHNLVSVEHLCRRAVLLVDGRVEFDGATDEAIERHLDTFPHAGSGAVDGVFDLSVADRSGTKFEPVFQSLILRPNGGAPSPAVRMGESLQVEIGVEGLDATPGAVVAATVGSNLSQCVFRMTTRMKRLEAARERRSHETIVLTIPSLPLTPGDYHFDLLVKDSDQRGVVDQVHRAAEFKVVPSDVLGTGYQYVTQDGFVVVPFDWEIRPSDPA